MAHNKHQHSIEFISEVLGAPVPCVRKSCKGIMIPVLARYENGGPLNHELECTSCGKVRKDPLFAQQRREQYEARHKQREQAKQQKGSK